MLGLEVNAAEQRRQHEAHLARRRRLWAPRRPVAVVAAEEAPAAEPEPEAVNEIAREAAPKLVPPWYVEKSARDWLNLYEDRGPPVSEIIRLTARYFGVSQMDLKSHRRTANVVKPRQIGMYLAKTMTLRSLPEIGRRFGGRDHTTVLHAVRKIGDLMEADLELRHQVEKLRALIEGAS